MRRPSPIGSLFFGALAGAAGSLVQNLFFKATEKIAPKPPKDAFQPPEPQQKEEQPTETIARRVVENLASRGPLDEEDKKKAQPIVHFTYGSLWGVAYGVVCESVPALGSVAGGAGFGALVWALSDNLILPSFRLAGWPQAYPAKNHAYALAAHIVYGLSVAGAYRLLRDRPWLGLLSAATVVSRTRSFPDVVKPIARPILRGFESLRRELPSVER